MNVITNRRHMNYRFPNAKLEGIYHDHRHRQLGNIFYDVGFDFCNHDQMEH